MRFFTLAFLAVLLSVLPLQSGPLPGSLISPQEALRLSISKSDKTLAKAFKLGISGFKIECSGHVTRKLEDDTQGIRHQRFIIRLATGQTLLIVHNIDLAPRVAKLKTGDRVVVKGEYIWNNQGGLMHLTHRDPDGVGFHGHIRHKGKTYR